MQGLDINSVKSYLVSSIYIPFNNILYLFYVKTLYQLNMDFVRIGYIEHLYLF